MLIQFPHNAGDQPNAQNSTDCDAFEAALRRDLKSAPVVLCGAMIGGWPKRTVDLTLALLTAPVWAPILLVAAGAAKLQHKAAVFQSFERIGYGGRPFRCWRLRMKPPMAKVEHLHQADGVAEPANDLHDIAAHAETRRAKWRRALERLPQMYNVIKGDMALVGPSPLSRAQVEPLKTAKRYYLSARPGVIGLTAIADDTEEEASQYKIYAMSWSFMMELLITWDALKSLRNRGELWRPGMKLAKREGGQAVVVRRREAAQP
jgi:exopolysaccharide production protein ExoY